MRSPDWHKRPRILSPGMAKAGIVEDSVAFEIAWTWLYGNCFENSVEIAEALGIDPAMPLTDLRKLLAIGAAVMAMNVSDFDYEGEQLLSYLLSLEPA